MFVSCVHPVAVINSAFGVTCSLLMLVEDARGDHMEEAYSRAGLMTALLEVMSFSFCLPHPVVVSAFIICRGLDGEAGWWTTSDKIGLPPLARVTRMGRQHREYNTYNIQDMTYRHIGRQIGKDTRRRRRGLKREHRQM